MPSKGNPHHHYRRSANLHQADQEAAAYFGETVTDTVIEALDRNLRRYRRALARDQEDQAENANAGA